MYDIRDEKRMWLPSSFLLKHGGGTLGTIKSPVTTVVCNYNHKKSIRSIMDLSLSASHHLMYFFS